MIREEFRNDLEQCFQRNGKQKLYSNQFQSLMNRIKNEYEYLNKEKLRLNFELNQPNSKHELMKVENDLKSNRAEIGQLLRYTVNNILYIYTYSNMQRFTATIQIQI